MFSLINRCVVHILCTSRHLWEISMLKGARDQTAVRPLQYIPSNLPLNEEDNNRSSVDPSVLLTDASEIWTVPHHMFKCHAAARICKYTNPPVPPLTPFFGPHYRVSAVSSQFLTSCDWLSCRCSMDLYLYKKTHFSPFWLKINYPNSILQWEKSTLIHCLEYK